MRTKLLLASLLLAAGLSPAMAATDFTGTSVTASLLFPDTNTVYAGPVSSVVTAGVEFGAGSFAPAAGSIDVGASSLTFFTNQSATYGTAGFNGYRIDFAKAIQSVSLAASSTFSPNSISFSGNSVFFNLSGQSVQDGQFATINISAVPEPATWGMMIVGFAMVGASLRRRSLTPTVAG